MVLSSISLIQNVMSGGSNARSEADAESPFLSTMHSPPKAGLPYLVVTIANGEVVDSIPVVSRDAARAMIAQKSTYTHGLSPEAVRH